MEIGHQQKEKILKMLIRKFPHAKVEIFLDLFKVIGIDEYNITNYQRNLNNNIPVFIYISNIYDFSKVSDYVSRK